MSFVKISVGTERLIHLVKVKKMDLSILDISFLDHHHWQSLFYILIFSSETTWPIGARFGRNVHWMVLYSFFHHLKSTKEKMTPKRGNLNMLYIWLCLWMVFNTTFNNISVISPTCPKSLTNFITLVVISSDCIR